MTAPMTMNRLIHEAVRRDLQRLTTGLDDLAEGDRARAQDLERAYANLRAELTRHHEGEDTHIWPMLAGAGVDPDLLTTMEREHSAMSEALADTAVAMSALARSGSVLRLAHRRHDRPRSRVPEGDRADAGGHGARKGVRAPLQPGDRAGLEEQLSRAEGGPEGSA
jgi:uncharacterized membrane protein YccC